jgi:hypothetical protein
MRKNIIPVIPFLIAAGLEVSPLSDWILSAIVWSGCVVLAGYVWGPEVIKAVIKRLPWDITITPKVQSEDVQEAVDAMTPRGFLDFLRDSKRNMQVFTRELAGMTADMSRYNRKIVRATKALTAEQQKRNPSIERAHKLITQIARDIVEHSIRMEQRLDNAEPAANAITADITSYLHWFTPTSEVNRNQLAAFRTNLAVLVEQTPQARESMTNLRESTKGLRDLGVSRDISDACGCLVQALDRNVNLLSAVTSFSLRAVKIIDDKLSIPGSASQPGEASATR